MKLTTNYIHSCCSTRPLDKVKCKGLEYYVVYTVWLHHLCPSRRLYCHTYSVGPSTAIITLTSG